MSLIKQSAAVIILLLCLSCGAQNNLKEVYFLEGIWQIEGKQNFEKWKIGKHQLEGYSYSLAKGEEQVSETLLIKVEEESIIYIAQVPNQNKGRAIPFNLNRNVHDMLSFENLQHDFPKKIQYKQLSTTKLKVWVLGDDDKGFSYHLLKQL